MTEILPLAMKKVRRQKEEKIMKAVNGIEGNVCDDGGDKDGKDTEPHQRASMTFQHVIVTSCRYVLILKLSLVSGLPLFKIFTSWQQS